MYISYIDTCTVALEVVGATLVKKNIRICREREGRIENSVPRIAIWHHDACPVMTNGDPEGRIFLSYTYIHDIFFF